MTLRTEEMSKALGITRQMLNKLAKENIISKEGKGKWNLDVVVREFVHYKIELAKKPLEERIAKFSNKNNPEVRLATAKADLLEIKLLEKQNELIPVELSESILLGFVSSIKEYVYSIPNKVAVRTLKARSKEEIKLILKNAIDEIFTKYSNIPPEKLFNESKNSLWSRNEK